MPRTSEESQPLLSSHRGSFESLSSKVSSAGASDANSAHCSSGHRQGVRSPFDTGIPMVFTSSPVPSPRPHRLSFQYSPYDDWRQVHVLFTLLMSAVGVGLLSIPYIFVLVTPLQAILTLIFVAGSATITAHALLHTHVQLAKEEESVLHIGAGKKVSSMQSVAIAAGGPALGSVVAVVTTAGVYGGCVACVRIARDVSPFLVSLLFNVFYSTEDGISDQAKDVATYVLWISFAAIVLPLCLFKSLSGLRISTYIGFLLSITLVLALFYRALSTSHAVPTPMNDPTTAPEPPLDVEYTGSWLSRFGEVAALITYAFMLHLNFIPLFLQLRGSFAEPIERSHVKMNRLLAIGTTVAVLLYAVFGLSALNVYGDNVRGNILLNLEGDDVMAIPVVVLFLTVILSYPLLFHPLRRLIEELLALGFPARVLEATKPTRLAATCVLLLSQILTAIWVPGLETVFALTGAGSYMLIVFVFPVVFFAKLYPWRRVKGGKVWMTVLTVIALVFLVLSGVTTVAVCMGMGKRYVASP